MFQVTLAGESAGAASVGLHLLNGKSSGMFTRVLMESNPAGYVYKQEDEARGYGNSFCKYLNCLHGSIIDEQCNTTCMQQVRIVFILRLGKKKKKKKKKGGGGGRGGGGEGGGVTERKNGNARSRKYETTGQKE